jgi:membrane protein DedA with SNARE-associated domain
MTDAHWIPAHPVAPIGRRVIEFSNANSQMRGPQAMFGGSVWPIVRTEVMIAAGASKMVR